MRRAHEATMSEEKNSSKKKSGGGSGGGGGGGGRDRVCRSRIGASPPPSLASDRRVGPPRGVSLFSVPTVFGTPARRDSGGRSRRRSARVACGSPAPHRRAVSRPPTASTAAPRARRRWRGPGSFVAEHARRCQHRAIPAGALHPHGRTTPPDRQRRTRTAAVVWVRDVDSRSAIIDDDALGEGDARVVHPRRRPRVGYSPRGSFAASARPASRANRSVRVDELRQRVDAGRIDRAVRTPDRLASIAQSLNVGAAGRPRSPRRRRPSTSPRSVRREVSRARRPHRESRSQNPVKSTSTF